MLGSYRINLIRSHEDSLSGGRQDESLLNTGSRDRTSRVGAALALDHNPAWDKQDHVVERCVDWWK